MGIIRINKTTTDINNKTIHYMLRRPHSLRRRRLVIRLLLLRRRRRRMMLKRQRPIWRKRLLTPLVAHQRQHQRKNYRWTQDDLSTAVNLGAGEGASGCFSSNIRETHEKQANTRRAPLYSMHRDLCELKRE